MPEVSIAAHEDPGPMAPPEDELVRRLIAWLEANRLAARPAPEIEARRRGYGWLVAGGSPTAWARRLETPIRALFLELPPAERRQLVRRLLRMGVRVGGLLDLMPPAEAPWARAAAGSASFVYRRGPLPTAKKVFSDPVGAAQANCFLDALRLRAAPAPLGPRAFTLLFCEAYAAYDEIVDVAQAKLDVTTAWKVALADLDALYEVRVCEGSGQDYLGHPEARMGRRSPFLRFDLGAPTAADRLRYYLRLLQDRRA